MIELSIGIVTYNNEDKIGDLLEDIFHYTKDVDFKVYIVDNKSQDGTLALIKNRFPQVEVYENKKNTGFGSGHNLLLSVLNSQYHLILNPDIRLKDNVFRTLLTYMDANEDVAMVTPRILNEDGTEQFLPKRRPSFKYMASGRLTKYSKTFAKIRAEYTMENGAIDAPTEIQCCTGCFMLVRTDIFKLCHGFDESFFMYLEDAELTDRVAAYGKVIFHPEVIVTHTWERTSAKNLKYFFIHMSSMIKYLKKKNRN